MAVGILTPRDCLEDDPSLGTLILSSTKRLQNPNLDRSPHRKRSTRTLQRNAKCDNKTYHGKQRGAMVLAPTRILKRGEVLDERTGVDLNESEEKEHHQRDHSSKQIRYSNSNVVREFYGGSTIVDSPHPSSVPLPTFLGPKRSLAPDLQMD